MNIVKEKKLRKMHIKGYLFTILGVIRNKIPKKCYLLYYQD
jgi:hypothetical protein